MLGAKAVKSISGGRFEITLFELTSGGYVIGSITHYQAEIEGKPTLSEVIKDYGTATFMFDLKLKELEGH